MPADRPSPSSPEITLPSGAAEVPPPRSVREYRSICGIRCRFEPPDLVVIYARGDVSAEDVSQVYQFMRECGETLYIVADVGGLHGISPTARKALIDEGSPARQRLHMAAMAMVNASWTTRTVITLVNKAYMYFYPEQYTAFAFFATEAEARAWIDIQRQNPGRK